MNSNRTMKVKINKKHPPTVFENLSGVSLCFLWFNFYYPQERVFGDFSDKDIRPFVRTPFHTPCLARYSVLHLFDLLSGGNISEMFCYRKT